MYIYKVGVVGAGTMGAQIAEVVSYAGLPVVLADVSDTLAKRGLDSVRAIYQAQVDKGKMSAEQLEEKMLLVTSSAGLDGLKDVDLVIEAVSEDVKLKAQVFHELDRTCARGVILASNTSALSISALRAATTRPDKVLGLHFFNPAYVMRLVEVVPGLATSTQTVDNAVSFVESIGKLPIVVKECAGFLVNRLLMAYVNEAVRALQEGVASAGDIDLAMVAGIGYPKDKDGPLHFADRLGIDQVLHELEDFAHTLGPRFWPAPMLRRMVDAGFTGQSVGRGFFTY